MDSVSIIVPVYNIEKDIEKCVHSLINQTYSNVEIILVNDGSTDQSGKIIDSLKLTDMRLKVIHTENMGVTHARKTGWRASTGDYCLFVDGDDSLAEDAVEYFICIFNSGEYDFVSGWYDVIYGNGIKEFPTVPYTGIFTTAEYIINSLKKGKDFQSIWIGMFRKELFNEEVFNIERKFNRGEDAMTLMGLLNNIKTIYCSDKIFYHYFQRMDSVTHTTTVPSEYVLEVIEKRYNILKDEYRVYLHPYVITTKLNIYYNLIIRDGLNQNNQTLCDNIIKNYSVSDFMHIGYKNLIKRLLLNSKILLLCYLKLRIYFQSK